MRISRRLATRTTCAGSPPPCASAAESFAYDLQAPKRAAVVGETTKGGAHPARPERIDARFEISLPYAEAVNPANHSVGYIPPANCPA